MPFQIEVLSKPSSTDCTQEGFLSRMRLHVNLQGALPHELLLTERALECLLVGVRQVMSLQLVSPSEPRVTENTLEPLALLGHSFPVLGLARVACVRYSRFAVRTRVFRVRQRMTLQTTPLREALAADGTLVRLFSRVGQQVTLQMTARRETRIAKRTFMWFDTRMCSLVDLQISLAVEGRPADLAHVRFLAGVDEQMAAKVAYVSERAVAVHALERFVVRMADHVPLQSALARTNHLTHGAQMHHAHSVTRSPLHIRNIIIFFRVAHIVTGSNFPPIVRIFISFVHAVHPITTNMVNILF